MGKSLDVSESQSADLGWDGALTALSTGPGT